MLGTASVPVGAGALRTQRAMGQPSHMPDDAPSYVNPDGTPTHVTGSPNQAGEVALLHRPDQGAEPNLANLLGSGETTFLVDFQPSNNVTLPAGAGSRVTIKVTNNSEWPQLLKRWSIFPSSHTNWLVRIVRGDGRFIVGDGWIHAQQIAAVSVPLQLGPGIALERLADLTFEFHNLSADPTDILIDFESLKVANPELLPSGRTLREQIAMLNGLWNKWQEWTGLNPADKGLGFSLHEFGRFYTFPTTKGVVEDSTDPHYQAIELGAGGAPFRGQFRNETGGVFVWQWIAFASNLGLVDAIPFQFEISAGGKGWKLTEGAVDSRLHSPAGGNSIGQWTPLWLPRPWIIKDQTTINYDLSIPLGAVDRPGVWMIAGGVLIGGKVL